MNFKSVAACAAAVVLGFCGCDSGSKTEGGLATGPRVADGAIVNAGYVKAAYDGLLGDKKGEVYANMMVGLPGECKDMLTAAGLGDAEVKWAGVTLVDLALDENGEPDPKTLKAIVALAVDHEIDKVSAAIQAQLQSEENAPALTEAAFLGEKGFTLGDEELTVAVASVGGKILVLGVSCDKAVAVKQAEQGVALYRDGKGGRSMAMGEKDFLKVVAEEVGTRVVAKLPPEALAGARGPEGEDLAPIFKGLKTLTAVMSATAGNGCGTEIRLDTASAADAEKLVAMANEALAGLRAMMAFAVAAQGENQEPDPEVMQATAVLNSISVAADGAAATVKMTIPGELVRKSIEETLR